MARWALSTQYGLGGKIRWKPPIVESTEIQGANLLVRFDEAVSAVDNGGPILGFALAGEDGKFHPADADFLVTGKDDRGREKKDNKTLTLTSPMVPQPLHFRYAWGRSPLGNLQASRMTDIPVATQRSDDWRLEELPLGVLGEEVPSLLGRGQKRKVREAHQALDQERLQRMAQDLLKSDD